MPPQPFTTYMGTSTSCGSVVKPHHRSISARPHSRLYALASKNGIGRRDRNVTRKARWQPWQSTALRWVLDPHPLRTLAIQSMKRWELGSYEDRVGLGAVDRPHYAHSVWQAASLAKRLNVPRISVIEFGVAEGHGLLSLEQHAAATSAAIGVGVDVYGFDTGHGLPAPIDFRDLPYHWQPGFFDMDEAALRGRIKNATLIIGDIHETLPSFVDTYKPAPIGAVVQDLDLYSSTKVALTLFETPHACRLPRILTYFDDIVGDEVALYNDYTGERLAIAEFNLSHELQKISPAYHLLGRAREWWHPRMFVFHDFEHPRYNDFVSAESEGPRLKPA
jgi:hypothetical protein